MDKKEIIEKINSFPFWMNQFDLKGNLTPVSEIRSVNGALQRKSYFFDPLVKFFGGSLKGKRILDIGCNAGFFALQAIESGCDYIVGIDGRQMHIDQANFVYEVKEVNNNRYEFVCGNVFDLDFKNFGNFDIVMCLGFFHHMNRHMQLLEKIAEVNNDILVLETRVSKLPGTFMMIMHEDIDDFTNSVDYSLTMLPTKKTVLSMNRQFGYNSIILKPQPAHNAALENYRLNRRKAFICSKKSDLSPFPAEVESINLKSEVLDVASMGINWLANRLRSKKSVL